MESREDVEEKQSEANSGDASSETQETRDEMLSRHR